MDGQRFDALAKAVTRRAALRRVGGGLAGALLAVVGVTNRAGAQEGGPDLSICGTSGVVIIDPGTDEFKIWRPCGGEVGCPDGQACAAILNPGNRQLRCRCAPI